MHSNPDYSSSYSIYYLGIPRDGEEVVQAGLSAAAWLRPLSRSSWGEVLANSSSRLGHVTGSSALIGHLQLWAVRLAGVGGQRGDVGVREAELRQDPVEPRLGIPILLLGSGRSNQQGQAHLRDTAVNEGQGCVEVFVA